MNSTKHLKPPIHDTNSLGIHSAADSPYSQEIIEKIANRNYWEITLGMIFLINISTFLVVTLCSFGLGVRSAYIYIICAYTIIGLNGAIQFYTLKKTPHKRNINLTTEVLEDSSISLILLVNATATQAASPSIIIALVTASIFTLSLISVKPFNGFVLSKILLLLTVIIYAVFFGNQSSKSVFILFPLIASFILLFSVGYWLYIRQVQILHLIFSQNHLHDTLNSKSQDLNNAHKLRDKIIRHIGHDLRQPINTLSYAVFNIKSGSLNSSQKNQLHLASSSIKSANHLIEEILQISTNQKEGVIDVNKNTVNVSDIFSDLENEFSLVAQHYNFEFRVINCSLTVYSDSQLITRILRNFISNSVRYAKGTKILVGARRKKDYLELQVIDNGIGMPKELLEKAFDEFTQGNVESENDGLGLGLNIAKNLSQALGCDVYIHSELNHGTLCALKIPTTANQTP